MELLKRWRAPLRIAFLVLLTVWPVTHLVLSRTSGLNPWKLMGWGMYSKSSPAELSMGLYLFEDSTSLTQLKPFTKGHHAYSVSQSVAHPLGMLGQSLEEFQELNRLKTWIATFQRKQDVAAYISQVSQFLIQTSDIHIRKATFFLAEPRVQLDRGYTYFTVTVFTYHDGKIEKLGPFSSETTSGQELLKLN